MIKIKCGTCGTSQGYKTPASGELLLPSTEEARLVARGVADYVTRPVIGGPDGVATGAPGVPADRAGENPPDDFNAAGGQNNGEKSGAILDIVDGHFTKESLMSMTRANMEKLAGDLGVDVSKCKNKPDIADLLASVEVEPGKELTAESDEVPPELGAEDPVT